MKSFGVSFRNRRNEQLAARLDLPEDEKGHRLPESAERCPIHKTLHSEVEIISKL